LAFLILHLDVSFLIVSWNVRDLLRRALASVLADAAGIESEIILVDNASRDGTVEMVRAEFPRVHLIGNADNRGFTGANNQALVVARGRYFFLLNPDAELVPGATRALVECMDADQRVGIAGPQLLNPDGTIQSSRRRFPTFVTALLESTRLQQQFPQNRWLNRYYLLDTRDDAAQDVDWVVGAAMIARRQVYEQIGGFDERFFMYSEELDWCYRAKRAGWCVTYFPHARVIHHEGGSSEQVAAARDIYFHSSKIRFFRKHHGALPAGLLRVFLLSMFAFQILEETAKWMLGQKRPLRAGRVEAYWQVLRSGLQ
jgi:N-acetylglucosaminyl-diphospho-decaprenol L-rhamnosyltransferase